MLKRALIYGALIAVLGVIWTMIEFALGFHGENIETGQYTGYLGLLFTIVGIVLAIRATKRDDPGPFSFGDGFKQGILTALVASLLGGAFYYIYGSVINPDYAETVLAFTESKLQAQGISGRELDTAMGGARAMSNPAVQAVSAVIGGLIGGAIVSAVAAALMRRKEQSAGDGFGGDGYGTPA